ncbi:MAG: LysM peptidoglycan-binding domain-containing protein, partial [Xanthomonadaceae bacterium]|nr:LysM peptidoglycan-binding domain-containing protein [Xanthomonadaceae bacterium]
ALVRPSSVVPNVSVGEVTMVERAGTAASPAPVATTPVRAPSPRSYRVVRGDTLSKIAQQFQCDIGQLARANGLRAPGYSVHVGQTIKLQGCGK